MAEEEKHGLAHGHHDKPEEHKDKDNALYWGLGLSAAGVLIAVLLFAGGGSKKQQGTNTVVQPSTPFIPNPSDVSIGSNAAPLYWPALPTSGTPHHPKTHHTGDKDSDKDSDKDKKKKVEKSHTTPNDHKGYGKSPTGASHGHTVTMHPHNPVAISSHTGTKGHSNG